MTAQLSPRHDDEGPPSTQFAATEQGIPIDASGFAVHDPDAPNPDTLAPDQWSTDGSHGNAAVPDIVTDFGGMGSELSDPSAAPTLSHIGRYAIKRQLGAGGLGTVFEAWDPLLSRGVALKTLQLETEPAARESLDGLFLNEARAAAGLNHRYIVTVYDAGLSPHGVYIAMERLFGRDLRQALRDGWRPHVEQAVQLVRRVTDALAYAHSRGVVHCDIKPANIFLQRRDRPKVLDFGIARILHGHGAAAADGTVAGSPHYRAPEQLSGGVVDPRTDLFSLGAVMFELLTGQRAFGGDTLEEINAAVTGHTPPLAHELNPKVPTEISAICARLLARNPADRYTCASELNADLRRWTTAQQRARDVAAANAARAEHAAPHAHRPHPTRAPRSTLAMAALAGLALMLSGAAAWTLFGRDSHPMAASTPPTPAEVTPAAEAQRLPVTTAPPAAAFDAGTRPAAPADTQPAATPGPVTPMTTQPATSFPADPRTPDARLSEAKAADARPRDAHRTAATATGATGQVQFVVRPWAEIEIDGAPAGISPPVTHLTLPEGSYTLTLRHGDLPPHVVPVKVVAGQPVTLRHQFGP